MMEGTPRHTHKNPVVSTSVVSWAYSEQEYQILELGLPTEAWDPLPVRLKDWEGSGEVGFRRQNHRKSEGCCIPAVGKCSGWPTWPPSPQPLALLPVGGTAEGPHDPRVPPLPEAPGQSSCAGLKRRIPRISRECWMGVCSAYYGHWGAEYIQGTAYRIPSPGETGSPSYLWDLAW